MYSTNHHFLSGMMVLADIWTASINGDKVVIFSVLTIGVGICSSRMSSSLLLPWLVIQKSTLSTSLHCMIYLGTLGVAMLSANFHLACEIIFTGVLLLVSIHINKCRRWAILILGVEIWTIRTSERLLHHQVLIRTYLFPVIPLFNAILEYCVFDPVSFQYSSL